MKDWNVIIVFIIIILIWTVVMPVSLLTGLFLLTLGFTKLAVACLIVFSLALFSLIGAYIVGKKSYPKTKGG